MKKKENKQEKITRKRAGFWISRFFAAYFFVACFFFPFVCFGTIFTLESLIGSDIYLKFTVDIIFLALVGNKIQKSVKYKISCCLPRKIKGLTSTKRTVSPCLTSCPE